MSKENKVYRPAFSGILAEYADNISDEEYAFYDYCDEVSDAIYEHMEKNNITKTELAKRLGKSKAFVTKMLRGEQNMTFKSFISILFALDAKPVTNIVSLTENSTENIHNTKQETSHCSIQNYSMLIHTFSRVKQNDDNIYEHIEKLRTKQNQRSKEIITQQIRNTVFAIPAGPQSKDSNSVEDIPLASILGNKRDYRSYQ